MTIRKATRATVAILLLATTACGGSKTTEKKITPDQIQLLATAFFNNYQGKGAEFQLTTLDRPGGRTITMSTFGASAPISKLQDKYGFTVDNVVKVAREMLETK